MRVVRQSEAVAHPCARRARPSPFRKILFGASFVAILLAAAAALHTPARTAAQRRARPSASAEYDLIIRNGRVVDGTGRRAFAADVAVRGDRIARVGRVPAGARARRTIDARVRADILKETNEWENIYLGSGGAAGVLVGSVVNRELEALQGKRVSEIAKERGRDELETLFDIVVADRGQTGAIYFMMSEADLRAALREPFVSLCTDSGARATDGPLSGSKSHPRGWGSYPRVLSRYVRDDRLLTIEQAVHKMTGRPAARVGLRDRGVLREGAFADITVFDPARVRDRATFEEPNQYPEGIPYVVVNGQLEVDEGRRTPVNAGRPLRGPGYRRK